MFAAILIAFGLVFLAELGDKSQLIAMTYALRYRWWTVLGGVAIASLGVHGLSVTAGHLLGLALPQRPIAAVAGLAFLCFAVWTWYDGAAADADAPAVRRPRFGVAAVASSVVLAELGDKTMLTTVALAGDHDWLGVWLGATAGMVAADAVAITVGVALHRRLPDRLLHAAASLLFAAFGLWLLLADALHLRPVALAALAALALGAAIAAAAAGRRRRGRPDEPARAPRQQTHG